MVIMVNFNHYEKPIAGNVSNMTAAIPAGINTTGMDESDTTTEGEIVPAQFCDHYLFIMMLLIATA